MYSDLCWSERPKSLTMKSDLCFLRDEPTHGSGDQLLPHRRPLLPLRRGSAPPRQLAVSSAASLKINAVLIHPSYTLISK